MTLTTELFLVLTENLVFTYMLGIPSLLKANGSRRKMILTGILSSGFIFICCTAAAWIRPILPTEHAHLLMPLCTALVSGLLDVLVLLLIAALPGKNLPRMIPYLHASAFSSAVLGAVLLSTAQDTAFRGAVLFGLRCGLGYFLASAMLSFAAPALYSRKMPDAVRGWRGMLLYTALLSMAAACIGSPSV